MIEARKPDTEAIRPAPPSSSTQSFPSEHPASRPLDPGLPLPPQADPATKCERSEPPTAQLRLGGWGRADEPPARCFGRISWGQLHYTEAMGSNAQLILVDGLRLSDQRDLESLRRDPQARGRTRGPRDIRIVGVPEVHTPPRPRRLGKLA